jgi:hypothetical protein
MVAENTAANQSIGQALTANDPDGDVLAYKLDGKDAGHFTIDAATGQIKASNALDYEGATSYSVTVTGTDGDGLSASISITITVTDVNEAPAFASTSASLSVAENTAAGTNIGSPLTANDPDGDVLAYKLDGKDAGHFTIDAATGQIKASNALDYEGATSYSVTVTGTDGDGLSASISITITVTDVNEAPAFASTSASLSVAENTAAGTNIGSPLTANDPDGDVLTYKLGGKDASYFAIDAATGQIKSSSALNYEGAASYSVTVTATDGGGLSASISITITVTDVNEAPAFAAASASLSVAENTAAGTSIGSPLTAADPEGDSLTYTLGGTDAGYFAIDAATGQVKTAGKLDYETQATYNVTVAAADDDGLSAAVPVTITVTDVYEPQPVNVRASAREDGTVLVRWQAPAGVGDDVFYRVRRSLDAADAKYSVVGRQVDGLEYQDGDAILAPGKSYRYSVRAFNGADKKLGKWTAGARVTIPELNRAPAYVLASATLSVAENTASGVAIGNPLTANDPDGDALTYTLSGADAGHFAIDAASGQVKTVGNLDYESRSSYTVTVTATDGDGLSASIVVSVSITDVYEPLLVNVQVTVQEDGAVLVSWNAAAGVSDDAFYRVRRSLGDAKFHVIARLVEGQSYRDGDQLEAGQSYRYSVRAFDASGKNLDKWTAAVKITIPTSGDGSG